MINIAQRKLLSETIRHLASGTISFKTYKQKRVEIFGRNTDFEELIDIEDEQTHDLTAIVLSSEALHLCELLRGRAEKDILERWFKSEKESKDDLRKKIAAICLFLYSDLNLYCFDNSAKMEKMPSYKYELPLFFLSILILIGGLFGGTLLTCYLTNNVVSYGFIVLFWLIVVSTLIISIAEYTQRKEKQLIRAWEKQSFYKYPFVSEENLSRISGLRLLGCSK
jgi:hypothetical protein